jgi:hypothetical protein
MILNRVSSQLRSVDVSALLPITVIRNNFELGQAYDEGEIFGCMAKGATLVNYYAFLI